MAFLIQTGSETVILSVLLQDIQDNQNHWRYCQIQIPFATSNFRDSHLIVIRLQYFNCDMFSPPRSILPDRYYDVWDAVH